MIILRMVDESEDFLRHSLYIEIGVGLTGDGQTNYDEDSSTR